MKNTIKDTVATRRVAILAADGVDLASVRRMKEALVSAGAAAKIVAPHLGPSWGRTARRPSPTRVF
jgi:catalase